MADENNPSTPEIEIDAEGLPLAMRVEPVGLETEMQRSYLDYAMSVIVSRALPDVRDGLKPVHRRVLYAMYDGGYRPEKGFYKCARVVGDVMGNYHPHGDSSIYDALVRLAQPWSMRMPLVDSNGNFGSPGNDPAAAMRYTECKMAPLSMEMVRDIDEETVDFTDNYDGRSKEPSVLPARFPNLLINGSAGIAVGMATNIPPHNLREVAALRPVVPGEPRGRPGHPAGRADRADQGPRLPDRRPGRRPQGHRGGVPDRARLHHDARGGRGRGDPEPPVPGRHRAALPGQPGQPRAEDRRPGEGRPDRRHRRRPRRDLLEDRPAPGHRPQAGRGRQGRPQQPLQAHRSADQLRRQHAGPGRRRAAHPLARRLHPALGRPPDRGHRPADPLPAAQGRGARAHPARSAEGAGRDRRGHRADPGQPDRRRRPRRPDGAAGDRRDPGQRHPGDAAPAGSPPWSARRSSPSTTTCRPRSTSTTRSSPRRSGSGRSSARNWPRSSTSSARTGARRWCPSTGTCPSRT